MKKPVYPNWSKSSVDNPTEAMIHIDRSLKYLVQVMAELDQVQRNQLRALNTLRTAANIWMFFVIGGMVLACLFGGTAFSIVARLP